MTPPRAYRRDGVGPTDPVLSDGLATMVPGISERTNGSTKFSHLDRLGTNAKTTDAGGNVVDSRRYDAFGLPISVTNPTGSQKGFASAFGYQEDQESGLKLLGHRYYDSATGRFITRDPLQDGPNWYRYVDNNPLKAIDADGLKKTLIILVGNTSGIEPGVLSKIQQIIDEFSGEYDIKVVSANNPKIVEYYLSNADAVAMVGHGWPFSPRKGNEASGAATFAAAVGRRRRAHRGKMDFLLLYSCTSCMEASDRVLDLLLANAIFGFTGNWHTSSTPSIWDDGDWWTDPRHPWFSGPRKGLPPSRTPLPDGLR